MNSIQFTVEELPPQKHGEKSMWVTQEKRIRTLRQKACDALQNAGLTYFTEPVRVIIEIHYPKAKNNIFGDLDNYITGIFDGLQAADKRVAVPEEFRIPAAISNDKIVFEVVAKKTPSDTVVRVFYDVTIEQILKGK